MEGSNYLIALAFLEQNGKLLMPLGGKSLKNSLGQHLPNESVKKSLISELLIRVIEKTENGPIKRVGGNKSILLIEISIEDMQKELPLIKSHWINDGDLNKSITRLKNCCEQLWNVEFVKYEGIVLKKI